MKGSCINMCEGLFYIQCIRYVFVLDSLGHNRKKRTRIDNSVVSVIIESFFCFLTCSMSFVIININLIDMGEDVCRPVTWKRFFRFC